MHCLTSDQQERLGAEGHGRHLERGQSLFAQGDIPHSLFLVRAGLLKISCSSGTGRDVITELLFPGDVCGILCGLDSQPYPVSAVCLTPVEIVEIPRDRFVSLTRQDSGVFSSCGDVCRNKMRFQRDMTVALAVERVEQRAARVLCMLAEHTGKEHPQGTAIDFPLSRQDFSELIGTALETGIRALSSLRRQGLVLEVGDPVEVVLPDLRALRHLADLG